jgi:hypothetical protein
LTEAMPRVFAADALVVWDVSDPASPVPVARKPRIVLGRYTRGKPTPATPVSVARKYRGLAESVARDLGDAHIRRDFGAIMLFQKLRLGCDLIIQVAQRSGTRMGTVIAAQRYLAFVVRWLSSNRWLWESKPARSESAG